MDRDAVAGPPVGTTVRYTESLASLSSYFDRVRDGVLLLNGPVAAGDVLVVRGRRIAVKAVSGEGPFTVWFGPERPSDHLPLGEPVRVFRPAVEEEETR